MIFTKILFALTLCCMVPVKWTNIWINNILQHELNIDINIIHYISNRLFRLFSFIIGRILCVEFWWKKIEGNLRRANTDRPYILGGPIRNHLWILGRGIQNRPCILGGPIQKPIRNTMFISVGKDKVSLGLGPREILWSSPVKKKRHSLHFY